MKSEIENQAPPIKEKHLSWLAALMTIGVGGMVIWVLYRQRADILIFPWRLSLMYLLLVSFFHSIALGATFWAWHAMISRLGNFTDFRLNFRYYYVSTLAKRLPTSLPYIGSRLVMYRQEGVSGAAVMNCILLENLLVGVGGVIVFLLFIPFYTSTPANITMILLALAVVLITALLARPQIVVEFSNWILVKLKRRALTSMPNRSDILIWVGIYTLPWFFAGASFYCLPRALSTITALGAFDALSISALSTLVSLSNFVLPGGLALKELTSSALLTPWMPLSAALVITIIYRVIHTADEILWALFALVITRKPPEN